MHSVRVSLSLTRILSVLAAALTALVILTMAPNAQAHSVLLGTDPDDGAQLDSAPEEVSLTFNEDITDLGTEVVITSEDGTEVNDGETQINGPVVSQRLGDQRPEGLYTVTWRAVSADGHPISGDFTFTAAESVGGAEGPGATDPAEPAEDDGEPQEAEATDGEQDPTADEAGEEDSSGLSASTWVIIGVLVLAAIILVTVLARSLGASKREE